ncbi:MAG: tRNA (adenosine(37)-N6)-threonylcarbamoyltransferase complex ATPase subunit type 1 TsaE [Phycisphaerales bacterium]|nr:tRNA (adenosine(37)-N6)-threonylcarbamoyltransferase complex ATPase subunit type 1 TsaE [Phycisphaerales bacterium]
MPSPKWLIASRSESETLSIGLVLATIARPGDLIAIDGPLGAGKTRLVRGLALGLGFDAGVVSSPTYVVVNEYVRGAGGGEADEPIRLFHADAYRLTSAEDLDSLGWERIIDGSAIVAIEWAERIAPALVEAETQRGLSVWRVRMEPVADETAGEGMTLRRVTIEPPRAGAWAAREGAVELRRLAAVLGEGASRGGHGQRLPRGWARCPSTGKPVPPDSPTFPFADDRARLADLGRWMSGAYTISRQLTQEDEDKATGA